jgi:dihydrofolate reductase
LDLFTSLDGRVPDDPSSENPMGTDWGRLTKGWTSTQTFHERILGDTSGKGTTGVDNRYGVAFLESIGSEVMGAGMFGLHAFPDDGKWKGWWGPNPPYGTPVYVLSHTAPRPSIPMEGGTTFHFRNAPIEEVLAEATEAAGGLDVRVSGGYSTARDFLRAGLVDDLHLMVAPILLGRGHRLLDDLTGFELKYRMMTEVAESGVIHVTLTR